MRTSVPIAEPLRVTIAGAANAGAAKKRLAQPDASKIVAATNVRMAITWATDTTSGTLTLSDAARRIRRLHGDGARAPRWLRRRRRSLGSERVRQPRAAAAAQRAGGVDPQVADPVIARR